MAVKAVRIAETQKTIFIEDDFVSAPKSLLSTSIFNIKGREKNIHIVKNDFLGYDRIEIKGKSLNLGLDFQLFTSILINFHENKSHHITISVDDFYRRIDPNNEQPQNKNGIFIDRLQESAKRLMDLKMEIISKAGKFVYATLFPTVAADPLTKEIYVSINTDILNIFKIDANGIFNIDFKIYNQLNKEYSKALYLYYITNNANIINTFSVEKLKERLMCEEVDDKKFNFNVSEAHKELKAVGFLKYAEKVRFSRIVTDYEVSTKVSSKEEEKEIKAEKEEQKNNNAKKVLPQVKEVDIVKEAIVETTSVEQIIASMKKPTVSEILDLQNMDKIKKELELFKKINGGFNE